MNQLLLTGPFGWNSHGIHISLRGPDSDDVVSVLLEYGCYPPAIQKIRSCLKYSGRYDCYVQATWFKNQTEQCVRSFRDIGIELLHDSVRTR